MAKKVLIEATGDERQTLAILRALRESMDYFPEALDIHLSLENERACELAVLSGLPSRVFNCKVSPDPYDVAVNLDLTIEDGVLFGKSDLRARMEEMRRLTGQAPPEDLPDQAYGMVSSMSMAMEEALKTVRPSYSISKKSDRLTLSPYASFPRGYLKSVKSKLRKSIIAWELDGAPVRDDNYAIIALEDESLRDTYMEMSLKRPLPGVINIYIDKSGKVINTSESLSLGETLAIIGNPSCLLTVSDNWISWLGWAFNLPYTVFFGQSDEWDAIRSTKALSFDHVKYNFMEWVDNYNQMIRFHLKSYLSEEVAVN